MNIVWAVSNTYPKKSINPEDLREIGSLWGGWKSYRSWATDNVICHDLKKAKDLVKRKFQEKTNFYIPKSFYPEVGRPTNVKLYDGDFPGTIPQPEELIALHLCSQVADVVLLLGYDLSEPKNKKNLPDYKNYISALRGALELYEDTQFVLVNMRSDLPEQLTEYTNLTVDTLENVIDILS